MIQTVKQACRFNPVIQDYRMSQAIENLADLINDAGDGREFFARNFVTHGMEQLFREGLLRLSGKSDQAVFELNQAMGGGKTHMMIAFGLLARHPHLRAEVLPADLNGRIDFSQARIAAFNGRNNPDHYLWGEIASQLGEAEAIKPYWVNGPRAVDQRQWKAIIGDRPDADPARRAAALSRQRQHPGLWPRDAGHYGGVQPEQPDERRARTAELLHCHGQPLR
jgi:hypothetical protein